MLVAEKIQELLVDLLCVELEYASFVDKLTSSLNILMSLLLIALQGQLLVLVRGGGGSGSIP